MKIPTPEERAKALLRIEKQTSREVAKCFSDLVDRVISRLGAFPEGSPLTPGENPAFARMLDAELTRFAGELEEANERGVTRAWTLSDHYGDIDTRGYLKRTGATALLSRYTLGSKEAQAAHRAEAMRAFLDRRDRKGFTISGRVWRTAEQAMQHIETSLAEGLAEGRSAAELSRTIRQDLREPARLYRRVRDKNGILQLSKPAKAYHPGAGVYRSSYKNALRLTRTEINVSYAEADFERWQRLDFVIGYEVRLSNNHTCNGHPFTDICDELAGKYPKWFKFTKWHPQCRCVCLAIFDDDPGAGEVRDVPPNFKQWVTDNQPRLDRSIKKGTAPYWVRDNFSKEGKLTGAKNVKEGKLTGAKKVKEVFSPEAYTQERKDKAIWDKGNGQLADDTLFDSTSSAWRQASKKEKDAIYEYTGLYSHINEPLRGCQYIGTQTRAQFEDSVNAITSYIDRATLPRDMWFQRGEDYFSAIESRLRAAGETVPNTLDGLVGKVMQEDGFMSTASRKGQGYVTSVIVNIYAPKGTKAAYVEPFSKFGLGANRKWDGKERFTRFGGEQETLFQRGTKMRITKVEQSQGTIYIDCEVIGQEIKPLSYVKDGNIGC